KGEEGRRLLFAGLENDGPVGEAAGAALEAGLHDLKSEPSMATLEVVIKKVNAGELHLKGPGKVALARLLSRHDMVDTLARAVTESKAGDPGRTSEAEGFGVTATKLEGTFGKILDDQAARTEYLSRLWVESSILLKDQAMKCIPGQ